MITKYKEQLIIQASGGNLRDLYAVQIELKGNQSNAEILVIATHAFSSNSSNLTNELELQVFWYWCKKL